MAARHKQRASIDKEQVTALHELAVAAELSYLWSSQLSRALDGFAEAARDFLRDYQAGLRPDPVPLLVRFGAANELLDQIGERFEIGAEALSALHFALSNPSAPPASPEAAPNLILLRPEERR